MKIGDRTSTMPNTPDTSWMLALESFLLDEPSVEAIRLDPA